MIDLVDLELVVTPQLLFDNFNSFVMSNDKKVFNKLISRTLLYNNVQNIPGDIVECGVFKGIGLYTFLKLKSVFSPNSIKKVIGFDFFDTIELLSSIQLESDKEAMKTFFNNRNFFHTGSFKEALHNKILSDGFLESDFELIGGDVSITTKQFSDDNPGFKISLLYLDLDLELPTYNTLINLWKNVTKGGIVVFDEYGHHKWSESRGVDQFLEEKGLSIVSLNSMCPTAYIQK